MKNKGYKISILFSLLPVILMAQQISLSVSAPSEVQAGQQFRLVYTLNAEADNFTGPDLKDFIILSGPSQSTSSNIQIINNQVTRSFASTFTYIIAAQQEGTFTIPAAKAGSGGKQYTSNTATIKVRGAASPPSGTQSPQQRQQQRQSAGGITNKDVFLRVVADKKSPYMGEQVIVTYKLYTRLQISSYQIEQSPSTSGFWVEELTRDSRSLKQYNEVVDGQQYTVAEIRQVALFPQRSGKLRIEPLEIDIVARVQQQAQRRTGDPFFDSFFNDPFFSSRYQNVNHTLQSNAFELDVKPLPVQNRPSEFSGAVGDFNFRATIDKTELAANEPINLKVVINGKGNVRLIDKLNFQFPPSFEVYDPKITTDVQVSQNGVSGTRTLEYLIIPRSAGKYTIKPVTFSYFNPQRETYVNHNTPEFNFNIARGEGHDITSGSAIADQQSIQYIASDIRFIRQAPFKLSKIGSYFFGSSLFYILLVSPLILFVIFVILLQNHIKNNRDIARVKNKRATRIARKRLKQAELFLKEKSSEKFFNELSQALWGYLSNKFNIPLSELSLETVYDRLTAKSVKPEVIEDFIKVLEQCEFARFAPGDKLHEMDQLYEQGLNIIMRIEKELK
ncbi:MAG: BatD family protein [Bacteroidales bacterium]